MILFLKVPTAAASVPNREPPPIRNHYQQTQQLAHIHQPQHETSNSARSTPFSGHNDHHASKRADESKSWSFAQGYQALDGSTIFHTTNGNPYCTTTTYQQGVS